MNAIEKSIIGKICTLHSEIEGDIMSVLSKSILLGELLNQQKESLSHGDWIPWVEGNLPFGRKQASKYMRVFENRSDLNGKSPTHLEGAIDSLATPKPLTSPTTQAITSGTRLLSSLKPPQKLWVL